MVSITLQPPNCNRYNKPNKTNAVMNSKCSTLSSLYKPAVYNPIFYKNNFKKQAISFKGTGSFDKYFAKEILGISEEFFDKKLAAALSDTEKNRKIRTYVLEEVSENESIISFTKVWQKYAYIFDPVQQQKEINKANFNKTTKKSLQDLNILAHLGVLLSKIKPEVAATFSFISAIGKMEGTANSLAKEKEQFALGMKKMLDENILDPLATMKVIDSTFDIPVEKINKYQEWKSQRNKDFFILKTGNKSSSSNVYDKPEARESLDTVVKFLNFNHEQEVNFYTMFADFNLHLNQPKEAQYLANRAITKASEQGEEGKRLTFEPYLVLARAYKQDGKHARAVDAAQYAYLRSGSTFPENQRYDKKINTYALKNKYYFEAINFYKENFPVLESDYDCSTESRKKLLEITEIVHPVGTYKSNDLYLFVDRTLSKANNKEQLLKGWEKVINSYGKAPLDEITSLASQIKENPHLEDILKIKIDEKEEPSTLHLIQNYCNLDSWKTREGFIDSSIKDARENHPDNPKLLKRLYEYKLELKKEIPSNPFNSANEASSKILDSLDYRLQHTFSEKLEIYKLNNKIYGDDHEVTTQSHYNAVLGSLHSQNFMEKIQTIADLEVKPDKKVSDLIMLSKLYSSYADNMLEPLIDGNYWAVNKDMINVALNSYIRAIEVSPEEGFNSVEKGLFVYDRLKAKEEHFPKFKYSFFGAVVTEPTSFRPNDGLSEFLKKKGIKTQDEDLWGADTFLEKLKKTVDTYPGILYLNKRIFLKYKIEHTPSKMYQKNLQEKLKDIESRIGIMDF